ncbi:MAG: hypothetical protein WC989_08585 [Micavibrio sp.]
MIKNIFASKETTYQSSARVIDGNLILTLPDALNPVVWRMELNSVKASALELRAGNENSVTLILKTPKGETHEIAPYDNKEAAMKALMKVSKALESAEGKITQPQSGAPQPGYQNNGPAPKQSGAGNSGKWLLALGGILLVIFLFAYLGTLGTGTGPQGPSSGTATTGQTSDTVGLPESADDLLKGF